MAEDGGMFDRLYARSGRWYAHAVIALAAAMVLVLGTIHASVMCLYYGLSSAQTLHSLGLTIAGLAVASLPGGVLVLRALAPVFRWQAGQRDQAAAELTWTALVARLPRVVAAITAIVTFAVIPAQLSIAEHVSAAGQVMVWVFGAVMTTGAAVLIYLTIEQGVRPVVHEASAALPADFAPPLRTVSLSAKLLGLLLTINVYSAMLMAAFSSTSLGREARLGLAVLLAFTFPLALSMLLRRSLTLRLHEFRRAFSRVREGDLEAQLPNLAGDELDEVGRSFNEMVAGLRERAQLQDDLQASRARIVAAADASRRAVERDLHDGAQQHLVLLKLQLGLVERTVAGHPQALESLSAAKGQLDRALAELRDLAHGIYPPALTNDGLAHALEEACARCGISTTVRCDADRHPPEVEAAVYFCCVEALQNAAKHAGEGAAATVTVTDADGVLRFEVADDGCGFDRATANGSSGLQNMADRVGALGGALRIEAAPHRGTRVRGQVPL